MNGRPVRRGRMAVLASEAALAGILSVPRATTALVAAGAGGMLLWHPEFVVLAVLLLIEELPASSPFFVDAPRVLTAGTELYRQRVAGLPLPLLLVGSAAAVLVLRRPTPAAHGDPLRWDRPTVEILTALSGWSALLSVLQDEDRQIILVVGHAVTSAGPWLAALAAYVVGTVLARERRHVLAAMVGFILVAKAGLGIAVELLTGGVTVDSQRFVIFYDAALPTLAAAVLVARLLTSPAGSRKWSGEQLVTAASAVVVVLSFRRAVWLLVAVAFIAVPLVRRRVDIARRVVAVSACLVAFLMVAPAEIRAPITDRVLEAVGVVKGENVARNSSQLHVNDLTTGFSLAVGDPWDGIGVRATQPPGLAVLPGPDNYLYVHNELLQTWLRFGLPGLVLLCALLGHLVWRSVRLLRGRHELDALDATGAVFAGGIAIPAMTAAFLSTTWRFPILLGLAAAVVDQASDRWLEPKQGQGIPANRATVIPRVAR